MLARELYAEEIVQRDGAAPHAPLDLTSRVEALAWIVSAEVAGHQGVHDHLSLIYRTKFNVETVW